MQLTQVDVMGEYVMFERLLNGCICHGKYECNHHVSIVGSIGVESGEMKHAQQNWPRPLFQPVNEMGQMYKTMVL